MAMPTAHTVYAYSIEELMLARGEAMAVAGMENIWRGGNQLMASWWNIPWQLSRYPLVACVGQRLQACPQAGTNG